MAYGPDVVDLYRRALDQLGQPRLPVAVPSPGFLGETDEQAVEELWPHYQAIMTRIGRERGWPPMTRPHYDNDVKQGALYVGSPDTGARKIAQTIQVLKLDRFDLKYSNGTLPHERMMSTIELFGTRVIPRVRELLAQEALAAA